jgi:RNA polymerase sigma-70 factor (ECF subfamily)
VTLAADGGPTTPPDLAGGPGLASPAAFVPAGQDGLPDDATLIAALKRGDEAAFMALVQAYHSTLVWLALTFVHNRATAEDVVQETWIGVLSGLGRFEARSSLKTWICRILTNRARTRAQREVRTVPFSSFWGPEDERDEPSVDPSRFRTSEPYIGHWASRPNSWEDLPEQKLLSEETQALIVAAIDALPANQRTVITLRDVGGWASADVCASLEISEANQRVLLHRARSKVRQALEQYLNGEAS